MKAGGARQSSHWHLAGFGRRFRTQLAVGAPDGLAWKHTKKTSVTQYVLSDILDSLFY